MFCRKCGAEMSDTARFCSKCGNDRVDEQIKRREEVENNHIIFQLKPEFSVLYQLLSNIGNAICCMFFICFVFIDLYKLWFMYPSTLIIITTAIMGIYVIVKMIFGKMQHDNLEYNFYATKIEYKDGFLNKEEKEIKYKFIREVTMSQNLLERFCGLGTIKIFTNASIAEFGEENHNSMKVINGIYIHCVDNVQEQYRIIKEIIDEGTPEE